MSAFDKDVRYGIRALRRSPSSRESAWLSLRKLRAAAYSPCWRASRPNLLQA